MKKLIIILLCLPLITTAQVTAPSYIGITTVQSSACSLLLDSYPSSAIAYSVRKVNCSYTGYCLKVRRSSDNTESDIGFLSNALDQTALLAFVGAGNGYVSKIYDQSGNGNDAVQTTTGSQPILVTSGVVNTSNSLPAIYFDGSDDYMNISTPVSASYSWTSFMVQRRGTNSDVSMFLGGSNVLPFTPLLSTDGNVYIGNAHNTYYYTALVSTSTCVLTGLTTGTSTYKIYHNNSDLGSLSPGYSSSAANFSYIGWQQGYAFSKAYLSEVIFYSSDKTSDVSGINSNINSYYSIY